MEHYRGKLVNYSARQGEHNDSVKRLFVTKVQIMNRRILSPFEFKKVRARKLLSQVVNDLPGIDETLAEEKNVESILSGLKQSGLLKKS